MRVLVIYSLEEKNVRDTIKRHLYSFDYLKDIECHYINVIDRIPKFLQYFNYDVVILHYTFLAGNRFNQESELWNKKVKGIEKLKGIKIAVPQDEYDNTNRLVELFNRSNISIICTCFTSNEDIQNVYKNNLNIHVVYIKVFTGYVDSKLVEDLYQITPDYNDRAIDIGYRARKLPAYFGKHGQLKYELIDVFKTFLKDKEVNIDIESTNKSLISEDPTLVKLGNQWIEFLLNCKSFVGCEGGSSLLDFDGSIKKCIKKYLSKNPTADFNELEKSCFPNLDYNIECFALSPRHFEAATCKTLQILVEGNYSGVFKPWVHYVPLSRDYSNLDEILQTIKDEKKCNKIVQNAYEDIVESGDYTYEKFARNIINEAKKHCHSLEKNDVILYKKIISIHNIIQNLKTSLRILVIRIKNKTINKNKEKK